MSSYGRSYLGSYGSGSTSGGYSSGAGSYGSSYGKSYGGAYGGDSSSLRSYGSQLSFGSSSGKSSYGGGGYDFSRRPSSLDRSLTYASTNRGNVSSLKDKFGTTSSAGRYSTSLDRGYGGGGSRTSDYGSRTGYTSDADTGSSRSYGTSYGRSGSSSVGIGRQSSLYGKSATREVSPVRTTGSRSSTSSRPDYGRSTSTSRDYGASRSRDVGTSYGSSYSRTGDSGVGGSSRTLRTTDYSLTPFSTRRTAKTSDTNLTPFSTRRGPSVEKSKPSYETQSSTANERKSSSRDVAQEQSRPSSATKKPTRRSRIASDESSDSANEPDGGNRDPNIRFLTSRSCSPMEPDFEFYESNKAVRKNKNRNRFIARTKTKTYPVKVYKRKRDRPRTSNRDIQVDVEELDRQCGRYRYDKDKYARMKQDRLSGYRDRKATSSRNSSSSVQEEEDAEQQKRAERIEQANRRHSNQQKEAKKKKDSVVDEKKARWEQLPQQRTVSSSGQILPKQSGFKGPRRAQSTADEIEYDDSSAVETEQEVTTVDEDEEPYTPRQSSYQERQRKLAEEKKKKVEKDKKKSNKDKTMPLTMENMSLKDSIEKVKNWKRQLQRMPPESPDSTKSGKSNRSVDQQSSYDSSVFTEEEYTDQEESQAEEPVIYGRDEYQRVAKGRPPSSRSREVDTRRGSYDRVLSPTGSEETGFLREDSPNRDMSVSSRGKERKMYAGVPQFPVHEEKQKKKSDNRLKAGQKADRSPSPYDNVDRDKRKSRPSRDRAEEDYNDRPSSPYDNSSLDRNTPAIVIDRVDNHRGQTQQRGGGRMVPAESIDSLATSYLSDDASFASDEETDISRAQSMVSLNTFPSTSLPRKRNLIPKAMSMDSLATSTSSLPDLVQSSEGSRRGYICRVQDIDSLLGFTETEDEFTEFSSDDSEAFMSADERYASKHSLRDNKDNDSVVLSPLKEEQEFTDDDTDSPRRARVEEIIYITDKHDIADVLGDDEPFAVNSPNIIENFQMEDISEKHPPLSLDLPQSSFDKGGSSDSLLDTPVPDTPVLPLAPVLTPGGSGSFPFPPQRTQSMDELDHQNQLVQKKEKHKGLDVKAKSTADLDDLDSLLDFAGKSGGNVTRDQTGSSTFDIFSKEFLDDQQSSSEPRLLDFDLVDSTKLRSSSPVPTAKLIDLSSDSNQSTPRHGSPASRRYHPDYSSEAVKQAMAIQEKNGVAKMKDLLKICTKPKEIKPPWIEDEDDRHFKGYHTTTELLEGLGVDVKKLDDCALQLYKHNGTQGDYGTYLDLDNTLDEQWDEFEGFNESKKNGIILRTKLSVRVHAIIEKLLNAQGRDLRKALFSLKQIFQDDKDLVHEFVSNDGLDCLIKVASEEDQSYQNYTLRAMGQVMLYVDGMNGVISHNRTVEWLYSLTASKFRLIVKTALKLLLVFVEYTECNTLLLVQAIEAEDRLKGVLPWHNIMNILNEVDGGDSELLVYAMTLINKALNALPDQDSFFDVTDLLEEQGMERVIQRHLNRKGTNLDLLEQFQIYDAVLSQEDGIQESSQIQVENLRNTPRVKSEEEGRTSRRRSVGTPSTTPSKYTPSSKLPPTNEESNKTESEPPWGCPGKPPVMPSQAERDSPRSPRNEFGNASSRRRQSDRHQRNRRNASFKDGQEFLKKAILDGTFENSSRTVSDNGVMPAPSSSSTIPDQDSSTQSSICNVPEPSPVARTDHNSQTSTSVKYQHSKSLSDDGAVLLLYSRTPSDSLIPQAELYAEHQAVSTTSAHALPGATSYNSRPGSGVSVTYSNAALESDMSRPARKYGLHHLRAREDGTSALGALFPTSSLPQNAAVTPPTETLPRSVSTSATSLTTNSTSTPLSSVYSPPTYSGGVEPANDTSVYSTSNSSTLGYESYASNTVIPASEVAPKYDLSTMPSSVHENNSYDVSAYMNNNNNHKEEEAARRPSSGVSISDFLFSGPIEPPSSLGCLEEAPEYEHHANGDEPSVDYTDTVQAFRGNNTIPIETAPSYDQEQTSSPMELAYGATSPSMSASPPEDPGTARLRMDGDTLSIASTLSTLSGCSMTQSDGSNSDALKRQSVSSLSDVEHMEDQGPQNTAGRTRRRRILREDEETAANNLNDVKSGLLPPPGMTNNQRWMMKYKMTKQKEGAAPQNEEPEENEATESISSRKHNLKQGTTGGAPHGQRPDIEVSGSIKSATDRLKSSSQPADNEQEPAAKPSGDMSGLLNKAKEGLQSSNRRPQPKEPPAPVLPPAPKKSETDLRWEAIEKRMRRELRIQEIDFTDLTEVDDLNLLTCQSRPGGVSPLPGHGPPPPPPLAGGIPPPPPPPPGMGGPPPPPAPPPPLAMGRGLPPKGPSASSAPAIPFPYKKNKKTLKLHWHEAKHEFSMASGRTTDTIWSKLDKEMGKVKIDTDKLEHLFETRASEMKTKKQEGAKKEITVLDPKRSNAINIGLTVLPPSSTIKTAIMKMDSSIMNREGIEKILSTMMPTEEEKTRILEAQMANPDIPLGNAEKFLLMLSSVSELQARLSLWAFKLDYDTNESEVAEPLSDLKQALEDLKKCRTFKYILAMLLTIGNFLNGVMARGFNVEYLAKVAEVKDTVHKHSLLYHLCTMVVEQFPDSTDLHSEIGCVARCAKVDWDELNDKLIKLERDCRASWDYLRAVAKHDGSSKDKTKLSDFLSDATERIILMKIVHKRVINRFYKYLLFMGYPLHMAKEAKVSVICKVISEFALEYRTTWDKVKQQKEKKEKQRERKKTRGKTILDTEKFSKKVTEKQREDDLKKILHRPNSNGHLTDDEKTSNAGSLPGMRTRRRQSVDRNRPDVTGSTRSLVPPRFSGHGSESEMYDTADDQDEIMKAVLETATAPSSRAPGQRKRQASKTKDRKSYRRTLKTGLNKEEQSAINGH